MRPSRWWEREPVSFGVGVGACSGVLLLAAAGAVYGLFIGSGANDKYPPGLWSAMFGALSWAVFLGPVAVFVGGIGGALYGLGVRAGARNRAKGGRPDDLSQ